MIVIRNYDKEADYNQINQFLIDIYRPKKNANWVQPRWEYMHYHPHTEDEALDKIGIFEDEGKIVAVVANEGILGEVYFLVHPKHLDLKSKMIQYAEDNLGKKLDNGKHQLTVCVREGERKLERFVLRKRYKMSETPGYLQSIYMMDQSLKEPNVPKGFRLTSLVEENKVNHLTDLLQNGFEELLTTDGVKDMQSAPHFDKSLHVLAVGPKGEYVSYCGVKYEPIHKIAYIQPVVTHPKYRRQGLASACVIECIKRVKEKGAREVIVDSGHELFQTLGFTPQFLYNVWTKEY